MNLTKLVMPFAVTILFSLASHAQDIAFSPTPGDAFVVKDSSGASVRFQVNESGEIIIPTISSSGSGQALCRDSTSGELYSCAGGSPGGSQLQIFDAGDQLVGPVVSTNAEIAWVRYEYSYQSAQQVTLLYVFVDGLRTGGEDFGRLDTLYYADASCQTEPWMNESYDNAAEQQLYRPPTASFTTGNIAELYVVTTTESPNFSYAGIRTGDNCTAQNGTLTSTSTQLELIVDLYDTFSPPFVMK